MSKVIVTNKGARWDARWNGENFTFLTGEPVTIPVAAATFLFNYGRPPAVVDRVLIQNGWLKVSDPQHEFGPTAAKKRLAQFIFKKAPEEERVKPVAKVLPSLQKTVAPAEASEGASTAAPGAPVGVTASAKSLLESISSFVKPKGDAAQDRPGAA